jgi:3'-phosphoadenosine 5'-phosphosulfate sulfotransferase (PAPS reductase)/FAD synthetase
LGKDGKDGDKSGSSGSGSGKKQKPIPPEAKMDANGRSLDPTVPLEEGFIGYHKGEDAWLRKLSMVDYLNWHDKIVVGFSSGKDSTAALIWILENCDKDKVFAFYTNPGWGVDWPHSLAFVPIIEKRYGIKVQMAGPSDPECIGGFVDNLVQMGYPGFGAGCWIESHVKIPRANALLRQNGLIGRESGLNVVQMIGIRWEESPNRAKIYPDRGYLKDNGNHYGNPILQWTGADVAQYLEERDIILHTAYQGEGRMGCLMCPKGSIQGAITIRKKFPDHWQRVLEFYAIGVRRGSKLPEHFRKWIMDIDSPKVKKDKFSAEFSSLALGTKELEAKIEEVTGEKLPTKPYLTKRFDPKIHKIQDDLRGVIFRQGKAQDGEYPDCGTDEN